MICFNHLVKRPLDETAAPRGHNDGGGKNPRPPQGDFLCRVMQCEAVIRIRPCRGRVTETITTNAFNDLPDNERRERNRNSQLGSHLSFPSGRSDAATPLGDVCVCWELIIHSQTRRRRSQTSAKLRFEGRFLRGAAVALQRCNTNSSSLQLPLKALKMFPCCTYFHQQQCRTKT